MPKKVKILLFAMIVGAGLIVFSVVFGIRGFGRLGANINQILNQAGNTLNTGTEINNPAKSSPAKSDIDKDGIPDNEEPLYRTDPLNPDTDGDGFLDGEEVASGCSPISSSPKDCDLKKLKSSGQTKINLTKYFSSLIVGGILSKDLNKNNPQFEKYVAALKNETSQIQKTLLSVDETELKIEITNDNSKKTSQEYLNKLENILIKYFFKGGDRINISNLNSIDFSPYLEDLNDLSNELSRLNPPPSWLDLHKQILKFTLELRNYIYNLSNQKEDPTKALLTLRNTQILLDEYKELTKEMSEKIKNTGLKSRIFNL